MTETVFGSGVKYSPSETMNPAAVFTIHYKPSSWELIWDIQDKVSIRRAGTPLLFYCKVSTLLTQRHIHQTSFPQSASPGLTDHFITTWGIKATNLVCWIVDFQWTCNPCCYYVFLARLHCKFYTTLEAGALTELAIGLAPGTFLRPEITILIPETQREVPVMAMLQDYMD